MAKKPNAIYKRQFIRLLSEETGFTVKECNIFWDGVTMIFARAVESKIELIIRGFGRLYHLELGDYDSWDNINKVKMHVRKYTRTSFSISKNFRRLIKDVDKEDALYEED